MRARTGRAAEEPSVSLEECLRQVQSSEADLWYDNGDADGEEPGGPHATLGITLGSEEHVQVPAYGLTPEGFDRAGTLTLEFNYLGHPVWATWKPRPEPPRRPPRAGR